MSPQKTTITVNSVTTVTKDCEITRETARETFREYLARAGLRVTTQRIAIFDAAFNATSHFTAEEWLENARAIDRSVSRATVYRSIPILTECGLVKEIDIGRDYKLYTANTNEKTEQAQVICLDCDRIFEIDAPFMEWYAASVSKKVGLVPETIRLQVLSRCERLRGGESCEYYEARNS